MHLRAGNSKIMCTGARPKQVNGFIQCKYLTSTVKTRHLQVGLKRRETTEFVKISMVVSVESIIYCKIGSNLVLVQ